MAFDPWAGSGSDVVTKAHKLEDVKESLRKRAEKRTVHQAHTGWRVDGESKLGDELDYYNVKYDQLTDEYDCDCYNNQYGDSRRRRLCSHVVAVMMFRENTEVEGEVSDTVVSHLSTDGASTRASLSLFDAGESVSSGDESQADGLSTSHLHHSFDGAGSEDTVDNNGTDNYSANLLAVPVGPAPSNVIDPDNREYWGEPGLPTWVESIHPHQMDAVSEAVEAYGQGSVVVWMDAPTGSGKTLIAELVRRRLRRRAAYICTTKSLQDQAIRDFSYAYLLKGRSNYPTLDYPYPAVTCADCSKTPPPDPECDWCSDVDLCPYGSAKLAAIRADLAILNTSYFLHECNYVGYMSDRPLVIADECDLLEQSLMDFAEFRLTEKMKRVLKVDVPKKGSHHTTIMAWLEATLVPAVKQAMIDLKKIGLGRVEYVREWNKYKSFGQSIRKMQKSELEWIRDNEAGPLVMKPLKVDDEADDLLWHHGKLWLPMSATIISPDVEAESLGLRDRVPYSTVSVPMTFPIENRPIYVAPVADMAKKYKEESWPKVAHAINVLMSRYPQERILVHTVSYDLSRYLMGSLTDRARTLTYRSADERERVLQQYRDRSGSVLLAPSFDRGVDLKGDDCRVVIVAKVPFPYLGDRQVSARANGPGGDTWYAVQTIRSLVQMTGRGVRNKEDWCHTYLLDSQFQTNLMKRHRRLFPKWWMEAVDPGFKVKDLRMAQ